MHRVNQRMRRVLCAGAELKHRQKLGARIDGQPQPQHLRGARSLVRISSNCRCGMCRSWKQCSCKSSACSPARDNQVVMVACRKPKTRSAADGSNPSARAASTMATWWEGVFSRYKGVSRRALNVVRQAWQRKVLMGSAQPCLPSPTRAWN